MPASLGKQLVKEVNPAGPPEWAVPRVRCSQRRAARRVEAGGAGWRNSAAPPAFAVFTAPTRAPVGVHDHSDSLPRLAEANSRTCAAKWKAGLLRKAQAPIAGVGLLRLVAYWRLLCTTRVVTIPVERYRVSIWLLSFSMRASPG
jgi:hypothetical protein